MAAAGGAQGLGGAGACMPYFSRSGRLWCEFSGGLVLPSAALKSSSNGEPACACLNGVSAVAR